MNLRDLMYFEVIAEEEHIGRASAKLGRSKPALTKCIQRMEDELSTELFRRQGRNISITPAGEMLLLTARHLRVASEESLGQMTDFIKGLTGTIRVGTGPTVAEFIMPAACAQLQKMLPRVEVSITVELGDFLRQALRTNQLDLIISTALPQDTHEFDTEIIADDLVVVVAPRGHPLTGRTVDIAELNGQKWILSSPQAANRRWLDWAFSSGGQPPPYAQLECNSMHMLAPLIAETGLLGFLPRRYLHSTHFLSALEEIVCPATTLKRSIGILRRKNGYLSPAGQKLVSIVSDVASKLP
mgnify:FL=1